MGDKAIGVLCAALALAMISASQQAGAQERPPDHAAILTLQDENASITTSALQDRYYVNGLRLSYTGGEDDVPGFLQMIGRSLWGEGRQRMSADLSQLILTPADTATPNPPRGDEPYAGVLMAGFSLLQDSGDTRSIFSLQAGLVGPAAGAEQVQNGFHAIITQKGTPGWCCYQIQNEPLLELTGERIWRAPVGDIGGLETDILPNVTVGIGNMRDYALAGAVFRIGHGLTSDFGVSRVRPGMTGGDAYTPQQPFNWYLFAGFDGQAVAHDITLDGNTFVASPSVPRNVLLGDMEAGAAIMFNNARITYTQVFQTNTFRGEHHGLHQFGSLAAALRF